MDCSSSTKKPFNAAAMPQLPPTLPDGTRLYASTGWWTNTNSMEFYVSSGSLVWGLWMLGWWLFLGDALSAIPTMQPLVEHFLRFSTRTMGARTVHIYQPQWIWGVLGMIIGGGHLVTDMRSVRWRMFWLFIEMMFWGSVGFLLFMTVPYSAAVVMYGGMCVAVGICYLRLYLVHGELFNLINFCWPIIQTLRSFKG